MNIFGKILSIAALTTVMTSCGDRASETETGKDSGSQGLEITILDTVNESNDRLIDSVISRGTEANERDLAIAMIYLSRDRSKEGVTRIIEVYDLLRKVAPDTYGEVVYDVNHEYERHNFQQILDQQINYLRALQ